MEEEREENKFCRMIYVKKLKKLLQVPKSNLLGEKNCFPIGLGNPIIVYYLRVRGCDGAPCGPLGPYVHLSLSHLYNFVLLMPI